MCPAFGWNLTALNIGKRKILKSCQEKHKERKLFEHKNASGFVIYSHRRSSPTVVFGDLVAHKPIIQLNQFQGMILVGHFIPLSSSPNDQLNPYSKYYLPRRKELSEADDLWICVNQVPSALAYWHSKHTRSTEFYDTLPQNSLVP